MELLTGAVMCFPDESVGVLCRTCHRAKDLCPRCCVGN